MKKIQFLRFATIILIAVFALSLSNCAVRVGTNSNRTSYKTKKIPPGQAKKIYGGKSAKRYAPGQNK
ncbi:hypothetical protein [Flavobacterium sp. 83]|uniref:hypothetical protein n=1 Tax=Flavobacterium sp. 83 TaxID=1131812 RepID=UPI0005576C6A|nr:hypothetical protein [Flavobacterium sp. 83]